MSKQKNEERVEQKLELKFRSPELLHTALVHRSYLNESQEQSSNERLEFLGDAVLEFIVSGKIVNQYKNLQEGELTALRSKLVNTLSLADVAKELGIGETLYISKGEEESGGRDNPALLADTFEAIIGALYLDGGIKPCSDVIQRLILPKAQDALKNLKDPKSLFQEEVQKTGKKTPNYRTIKEEGPDHAKVFTVGVYIEGGLAATGQGKSKQDAQQEAAKQALKQFGEIKESVT